MSPSCTYLSMLLTVVFSYSVLHGRNVLNKHTVLHYPASKLAHAPISIKYTLKNNPINNSSSYNLVRHSIYGVYSLNSTVRAYAGRSLAERHLNRPRALSSRWVSAQATVSSSDYCEETPKQLAGGRWRNKRHSV